MDIINSLKGKNREREKNKPKVVKLWMKEGGNREKEEERRGKNPQTYKKQSLPYPLETGHLANMLQETEKLPLSHALLSLWPTNTSRHGVDAYLLQFLLG